MNRTELGSRVASIPASYWEDPGFKSMPKDRLSWCSSVPPGKIRVYYFQFIVHYSPCHLTLKASLYTHMRFIAQTEIGGHEWEGFARRLSCEVSEAISVNEKISL